MRWISEIEPAFLTSLEKTCKLRGIMCPWSKKETSYKCKDAES